MGENRRNDFDPSGPEERDVAAEAARDDAEFLALMPHFYRGEMSQMETGEQRIDQTTDWAVAVMAAILALVFSGPDVPVHLLFVGMLATCAFLVFETRRYRAYDAWRARVRVLQENLFANAFDPVGAERDNWREELSDDLRRPTLKISFREALSRRLKRVYGPLLVILGASWFVQIAAFHPDETMLEAAAIEGIPGAAVVAAVAAFYLAIVVIAFWPAPRQAKGEFYGEEIGDWKGRK